ncbi:MAG: flagellar FliJ family protein [Oscillospiraceae bacterium]|nr:flagellar FliJ family protein [Oscillospiraceae bacterium]MBP1577012.1 flagellar FliJ family protein [Oscillospiraceae bacterium]
MKKFNFPLEKVLRFRTSLLDEEKNKLAELRRDVIETENKIDDCRRQMAESDLELKESTAKGTTIQRIQILNFQIESARNMIEELEKQLKKQQLLVERQLGVVLEATKDVNGLERLKEKQREEYNEAVRKEDDLTISELVSSQYVRDHSQ